jgi:outer membrane protein assembly factor BamB
MKSFLGILFCSALITLSSPIEAENWPCFRGPTRQGVSKETGLALHWNAASNVLWKTAIPGEAWSSPIAWGDRIFLTTATENGASCRVLSLDRQSGRVLWDKEAFRQVTRRKEARNSYATPTPCTDGERVYAVFGDGSFVALDFSGNTVWINRDFPHYSQHGLGTSAILHEDLLIMARDASSEGPEPKLGWQIPWDKSFLIALDTKTGKPRWQTYRGLSRIGHVVPNVWIAPGGTAQIISSAGDVVQGFDARTGERIWSSINIGEGVVPSIVLGEGLVFTASGWGGREVIKAFRLGGRGDLGETNLVWEERKGLSRVPSYLYLEPHLYTITDGGVATCFMASSGQIVWQERVGGNFSASPVTAEGRIYLVSDSSETTVIAAGPEFKVLARNPLEGERVQASAAISSKTLFIRTSNNLYAIGTASPANSSAPRSSEKNN